MHTPTVLTIAGFDPYGGAGIIIDTKTIHAMGGYACSVTTAITAQNSQGVYGVEVLDATLVARQLEVLLADIDFDAIKIGMLGSRAIVERVAEILSGVAHIPVVLDPVLVSSSGRRLLEADAIYAMTEQLFPLSQLVTPNLDESNALLGGSFEGTETMQMAQGLFALGADAVLLKGGHTKEKEACDRLVTSAYTKCHCAKRIDTSHTHGTGCLLSSAIATGLAKGLPLDESVAQAKAFLTQKLQEASSLVLPYRTSALTKKEPIF